MEERKLEEALLKNYLWGELLGDYIREMERQ